MASDDDLFLRTMEQMGVRPGRSKPMTRTEGSEGPKDDGLEGEMFLKAMADLAAVHDKDRRNEDNGPLRPVMKRLPRKSGLSPEDELDLHGLTVEEALNQLAGFVSRAFAHNHRTVSVVTGKGLHSKGGVGVLKLAVEQWIVSRGKRCIESYDEAPRAHGGKGAIILNLRRS